MKVLLGSKGLGNAKWAGPLYPKVAASGNETLDCNSGCLFNVTADPGEHNDLGSEQPAVLK